MIKITVDSRETNSGIIRNLSLREDVEIEVKELDIGDYILGPGVGVERKEATDFVNSLISEKRLFQQAQNMVEAFENATMLLEGNIFNTRSLIKPAALCGALSHLRNTIGIAIISTNNQKISEEYLYWSARHIQQGLGYDVALRSASPKNPQLASLFLLEGLPAIGPTTAMKLLNHFGSARAVFTASKDQLKEVPGLGPKTIEKIVAQLDWELA